MKQFLPSEEEIEEQSQSTQRDVAALVEQIDSNIESARAEKHSPVRHVSPCGPKGDSNDDTIIITIT
jgi:hypothetical protein